MRQRKLRKIYHWILLLSFSITAVLLCLIVQEKLIMWFVVSSGPQRILAQVAVFFIPSGVVTAVWVVALKVDRFVSARIERSRYF